MLDFLMFLKPFVDMLWQYAFLDFLLMSVLLYYTLINQKKLKLTKTSFLLLLMLLSFTFSFLLQVNIETFRIYIKLVSAILMFVVAQVNDDAIKTIKVVGISYFITLNLNAALAITGNGYTFWGDIFTFTGLYYYKTDLAISVILGVIFIRYFLFYSKNKFIQKISFFYIFIVSPYLILKANSRMMMLIYAVIIIIIIGEYLKKYRIKKKRTDSFGKLSLGIRFFLLAVFFLMVSSTYFVYNSHSGNQNMLNIDFNNLFSERNTQGRTNIWSSAISGFSDGPIFNQFFGYYINADFSMTVTQQDAHNNFIKILINFGYIGLILFFIFMFRVIHLTFKAKKTPASNDSNFILNTIFLLFIFFNIEGLAQSNIIYTQSTWVTFYFFGLLNNKHLLKKTLDNSSSSNDVDELNLVKIKSSLDSVT